MVVLGAAVFIAGAGLVFVGLRSDGAAPAADGPTVITSPTGAPVEAAGGGTEPLMSVRVPKGHEAVAIQLQAVPGLAGYAQPGSRVNVYATVKGGPANKRLEPPYAKLVLTNVEVLDVTTSDLAVDPTFLLALEPADAERVIFFSKFEGLWFSLVPPNADDAGTKGFDYTDALKREAR